MIELSGFTLPILDTNYFHLFILNHTSVTHIHVDDFVGLPLIISPKKIPRRETPGSRA